MILSTTFPVTGNLINTVHHRSCSTQYQLLMSWIAQHTPTSESVSLTYSYPTPTIISPSWHLLVVSACLLFSIFHEPTYWTYLSTYAFLSYNMYQKQEQKIVASMLMMKFYVCLQENMESLWIWHFLPTKKSQRGCNTQCKLLAHWLPPWSCNDSCLLALCTPTATWVFLALALRYRACVHWGINSLSIDCYCVQQPEVTLTNIVQVEVCFMIHDIRTSHQAVMLLFYALLSPRLPTDVRYYSIIFRFKRWGPKFCSVFNQD